MSTGAEAKDFATLKPTGHEPKIHTIFDFTDEALQQLRLWLEMHPPSTPIELIRGFSAFTLQTADQIIGSESTTSTSYTNLATVGPTITGLPAGKYSVFFGALASISAAGEVAYVSPSFNGATPDDDDSAQSAVVHPAACGISRLTTFTFGEDNNAVQLEYRSSVGSATARFNYRWLAVLKYANV